MDSPIAPAVPAQPAPETVTASSAALDRDDFAAFDHADTAARRGNPSPAVAAPPVAAAPAPQTTTPEVPAPVPGLSKRQQQINEYERRIAEQEQRIRALEARTAPPPAAPPVADPKKDPEWKRFRTMPDAPKLDEFESVEDHAAAMALFVADKRHEERAAADRQRADGEKSLGALHTKIDAYAERMKSAIAADPDLQAKIAPEILAAHPISAYPRNAAGQPVDPGTGQPVRLTFANAIAEVAFHSEHPAALYTHLTADTADAQRIASLPPAEAMQALIRLDGRLSASAPTPSTPAALVASPALSTVSNAPPPAPILTKPNTVADPKRAALERDDFAAFDRIEQQERRARSRA